MKKRDLTYDLMKGIAILLMMVSHLVLNYGLPKQIIYSFHMPLFFILSGLFAKDWSEIPSFKEYTSKNARRLLLPYFVTMLMLCGWGAMQAVAKHDVSYFMRHFFSMLTASADSWNTQYGLIYAGPMWFLISLFFIRELFYGIQSLCMRLLIKHTDENVLGICVILSVLSTLIHPLLPALPFSVIQAFASISFYAVGWYIHKHPMPWWVYGLSACVWPIAILYGGVDLASCQMEYYPLSFIGACGGTYVVYLCCKGLTRVCSLIPSSLHPLTQALTWCGVFSLPILCMHELELYSGFIWSLVCKFPMAHYLIGWGEVGIGIFMAIIVLKIPYMRNVYK